MEPAPAPLARRALSMNSLREDDAMKADIIFIHGMWSRHTVWHDWKHAFEARGHRCLALDLPGHLEQGSDTLLAGATLQSYVDEVLTVARQFTRPILVGHSLGGLLAQLAAQHLDLSGVVLVNSAAPRRVFPLRPTMLPGLARHFSRWGLWRRTFRLSNWEADYLIFNRLPPEQRPACRDLLIAESGKVAYEVGFGMLNLSGSNDVRKELITCPMLALAGASDRIIPRSVSRNMARWYGQRLEYRELPGHGHWVLGEPGWQAHVDHVLEWIDTASQSRDR